MTGFSLTSTTQLYAATVPRRTLISAPGARVRVVVDVTEVSFHDYPGGDRMLGVRGRLVRNADALRSRMDRRGAWSNRAPRTGGDPDGPVQPRRVDLLPDQVAALAEEIRPGWWAGEQP